MARHSVCAQITSVCGWTGCDWAQCVWLDRACGWHGVWLAWHVASMACGWHGVWLAWRVTGHGVCGWTRRVTGHGVWLDTACGWHGVWLAWRVAYEKTGSSASLGPWVNEDTVECTMDFCIVTHE